MKSKYKLALVLFAFANINAVLNTLVIITTRLAEGDTIRLIRIMVWEFSGSYSFFLLSPIMLILIFKYPLIKGKIFKTIPIYLLTIAVLGAVHTINMYLSRIIIYDLAGWGHYGYGYPPFRYIMETLKLGIGFLVLYLVFSYIKSNKEKQEHSLKTIKLEEQLSRTRLELLKNQIHPHFLFNTLNMISSTMYEDVQTADKMIANLSDLLRITLNNSKEGITTLKEEMEILSLYLDIMKERYKDKLIVELIIDDNTKQARVPSFLLQPIVENSIKHGMESLSLLKIEISSKKIEGNLVLNIHDNGSGIDETQSRITGKGTGLSNISERLENLYKNNFEFYWENVGTGGLSTTIKIPFLTNS